MPVYCWENCLGGYGGLGACQEFLGDWPSFLASYCHLECREDCYQMFWSSHQQENLAFLQIDIGRVDRGWRWDKWQDSPDRKKYWKAAKRKRLLWEKIAGVAVETEGTEVKERGKS